MDWITSLFKGMNAKDWGSILGGVGGAYGAYKQGKVADDMYKLQLGDYNDEKDRQTLKTLRGEYVDFEEAYIICGQCHVNQTRDWAFGAHGKRVNNWKGKRQVYNCTVCHYQHDPTFKPRKALAGPEIRMGLERPDQWVSQKERNVVLHGRSKPWQKHAESKTSGIEHE